MRHQKSGRKLNLSAPQRTAMMRSLTLALIENSQIKTTPARAKQLRSMADRVVTLAKENSVAARRRLVQMLGSTETSRVGSNRIRLALEKLHSDIAPRFKNRHGGYTQIVRTERRRGDNAELCFMRYLPSNSPAATPKAKKKEAAADKKVEKKEPVAKKTASKKAAADKTPKAKAK